MKKKVLAIACAVLVFFMALGLTLYPLISSYVNEKYRSEIHTQYQEVIEQTDNSKLVEAMEAAHAYNKSITPGAVEEDNYSREAILEASVGYEELLDLAENGTMAYVEIPKIAVNLPVYHGTESDSLERGVGHLLGSSLPVGGISTHAILTGHSGMASQKMFTDLVQLELGDKFYIHVLNETLAYEVDSIKTVLPYDTSLLQISQDEDLCTLITCTPLGVNTHRLLVRGSRIPYVEAEKAAEETICDVVENSAWEQEYLRGIVIGLGTVAVLGIVMAAVVFYRRHKHEGS